MKPPPGFREAERIALLSIVGHAGIGISEILIGLSSGSLGVVADGIDSIGNSLVTSIVWGGLRISRRRRDRRFHFGYYRVESLASLIVAFVLIASAGIISYGALLGLITPQELRNPTLALSVAGVAGVISIGFALYKLRVAKRMNLLSLKADAYNTLKDGSGSFLILVTTYLTTLGYRQLDAVGAMILAGYIATVAIQTLRESSLILIDACHSPELVEDIKEIVERTKQARFRDVRLRWVGPYIIGELEISVDGRLSVYQLHEIKKDLENTIKEEVQGVRGLIISAEPV